MNNNQKSKFQQDKRNIKKRTIIVSEKKNIKILLIIIAFCIPVLLYLQTISFGFAYFDDDGLILDNFAFLSNFRNVNNAFLTDAFITKISSFYRPFQTLSYMIDIQLSGAANSNPWFFHLTNILLLGLTSCLLFLLLIQFSIPPKLALISTLIYCTHPLFISSISWIPARGDLLLMFFSLLSFLFLIKYIQNSKIIYLFLNWSAFTFALFCKETAVLLPLLFVLYYYIFSIKKNYKKYILITILYCVSGFFWFYIRLKAIGGISNPHEVSIDIVSFMLNFRTIPESITKFFLFTGIAPIPLFSLFKTLTGMGIIVIMIIIGIKNNERSLKEKIFCFAWFLLLMLPPMLFKNPSIDYLDHRFFLPLIGILLFLLFLLPINWLKKNNNKFLWPLFGIFIFLCSLTFIKSRAYCNELAFYNSAITNNPNYNIIAYINRGRAKLKISDFKGAIEDYKKVLSISPKSFWGMYGIGVAKEGMGQYLEAIEYYGKAISLNPNFVKAYFNQAVLKAKMGNNHGALEDYNKAIEVDPGYILAYCNRGVIKVNMGDNQGAIEDYNMAIKIDPGYFQAYFNRGIIKANTGDNYGAIEDYSKTIEINPSYINAYFNRGLVKSNIGDKPGAFEDYNKTIALDPGNAEAYNNKGALLNLTGNFNEALINFNKAIEIKPEFLLAFRNRAFSKYMLKDLTGASEDCEKMLKANPNDEQTLNIKAKVQKELLTHLQ